MTRMTGGQAAVATLEANGANLAFGMPGIHNLPIYDALLDRPAFRSILVHNEQSASYMANGAGRTTRRPGVCIVTTGPAACNALAGVADAARDSAPMLVIASQISSHLMGQGKGAFHEMADQMGMYRAAGAWTARPNRVEQIPAAINAAWAAITYGRPQPAYVEIPEDILRAQGDAEIAPVAAAPRPGATPEQVERVLQLLQRAQRPLVYVGAGAARSGAEVELTRFIERFNLPAVSTVHGKGVVAEDHPLSAGALPIWDVTCQTLFAEADLVLALGTGFSEVSTNAWTVEFPRQLIHVDIDGSQIGRSTPATLGIVGDVRTIVAQLNAASNASMPSAPAAWTERVLDLSRRVARAVADSEGMIFMQAMRDLLPRDAIVVGDAQGWGRWPINHFPTYAGNQMLWPIHFGTLGYSVPAAIGVQAAFPERRVVAACGDGGFLFCSNELATAMQHDLPIIVILVNNDCYYSIRASQERRYGKDRVYCADLQNPNFVAYAESFGCFGRRVSSVHDFEPALRAALAANRPAVLEITFPVPRLPNDFGLGDWKENK
jgi:thiamine pyrophosphate-dependent acetolactate synthase large subunit-like protein